MRVTPGRVALLMLAALLLVAGAVVGKVPQCNLVSVSREGGFFTTLAGCGRAPWWFASVIVAPGALALALALWPRRADPVDRRVRIIDRALVIVVTVSAGVVLFLLLRPGDATIETVGGSGELLCHRPLHDLDIDAGTTDLYAAGCRDLAQGRLGRAVGTAVLSTVVVGLLVRGRMRPRGAHSRASEAGAPPAA